MLQKKPDLLRCCIEAKRRIVKTLPLDDGNVLKHARVAQLAWWSKTQRYHRRVEMLLVVRDGRLALERCLLESQT